MVRCPASFARPEKLVDRGLLPGSDLAADVFHSTHFPLPRRNQRRSPQRFITIYDLRHRAFPHLYDSRTIEVSEQILHSVESDDWVITTSAASRDELAATGAVRPQQIFVVPLAADPQQFRPCRDEEELQRVRTRYGIGDAPYILSVSSVDVRKNTHGAIEAFARLANEQRLGDLKFVIAGSSGSGSPRMQQALSRNIGERIIQTGFVETETSLRSTAGRPSFSTPPSTKDSVCRHWKRCRSSSRSPARSCRDGRAKPIPHGHRNDECVVHHEIRSSSDAFQNQLHFSAQP